uniref:Uncharacterized protein n=1 Tax=Arion vulgaris TaxID=1028688 RepID=A0A0B6ZGF5_9EUPU
MCDVGEKSAGQHKATNDFKEFVREAKMDLWEASQYRSVVISYCINSDNVIAE